jgi:hypothetical protein
VIRRLTYHLCTDLAQREDNAPAARRAVGDKKAHPQVVPAIRKHVHHRDAILIA